MALTEQRGNPESHLVRRFKRGWQVVLRRSHSSPELVAITSLVATQFFADSGKAARAFT